MACTDQPGSILWEGCDKRWKQHKELERSMYVRDSTTNILVPNYIYTVPRYVAEAYLSWHWHLRLRDIAIDKRKPHMMQAVLESFIPCSKESHAHMWRPYLEHLILPVWPLIKHMLAGTYCLMQARGINAGRVADALYTVSTYMYVCIIKYIHTRESRSKLGRPLTAKSKTRSWEW